MKVSYTFECDEKELKVLVDLTSKLVEQVFEMGTKLGATRARSVIEQDEQSENDVADDYDDDDEWPSDDTDETPESEDREPEQKPKESDLIAAHRAALAKIDPSLREAAKLYFRDFCVDWAKNFEQEGEQPDRLKLMEDLGSSRYLVPVLVMAYEKLSLQGLIMSALMDAGLVSGDEEGREFVDKIAMNMVQVSHKGCPDLAGTYDYTTRWKRMNNV